MKPHHLYHVGPLSSVLSLKASLLLTCALAICVISFHPPPLTCHSQTPVATVTSLSHLCEGLYIIYALCLDSNPTSIYLAGSQILSGDRLGTMSIKQNRLPTHLRFLMPFFFLQSAPVLSICLHCV